MSILYKLGGSLLDIPNLGGQLESLIDRDSNPLLLVGGGATVDLVRNWDQIHHLGEERSHNLALQAMRVNSVMVSCCLDRSRIVTSIPQIQELWQENTIPILDGLYFLDSLCKTQKTPEMAEDSPSSPLPLLPETWKTTSDSIALWLANALEVKELHLLKSADRPSSFTWQELAEANLIDEWFPHLWKECRFPRLIHWTNMRKG